MNFKSLFNLIAGVALIPAIFSACETEKEKLQDALDVVPSEAITFQADGNSPVTLAVNTDADNWSFEAPQWAGAVKSNNGTTLVLTPEDNTTDNARVGRVLITAGNANPVKINVFQASKNGDSPVVTYVKATIVDAESETNDVQVNISTKAPQHKVNVKVVLEEAASEDMEFSLAQDEQYAAEYSYTHEDLNCVAFPAANVSFSGNIKIAKGQTESEPVEVTFDAASAAVQTNYIVSLVAKDAPAGVEFTFGKERMTYLVVKRSPKEIKNVVYLEVNNTNPLNLLEYKLEDGTPFFDVVILFAANINYSDERGVYLHNNPNVQELLDKTDVYLQPLREAGIEVQLGLLPNHTPAGLVNLSRKGADMFAEEVSEAVKDYKLDGASMDEEYRSGYTSSDLIGNAEGDGGMYLCWKLRKLMNEKCPDRECKISIFYYAWGYSGSVTVDGVTYDPAEFIDFTMANYGGSTSPWGNQTLKNCSCLSIECNRGYSSISESQARAYKEQGYGWLMWFAFHPQNGGGLSNNASRWDPVIKQVAKGFYDMELQTPTGYYTKIGEGQYDPTRYDRTW